MVAVQATALSIIKHHARAKQATSAKDRTVPTMTPMQASQFFRERAVAERATRNAARVGLNADRYKNTMRAAPATSQQDTNARSGKNSENATPSRDQLFLSLLDQRRSDMAETAAAREGRRRAAMAV